MKTYSGFIRESRAKGEQIHRKSIGEFAETAYNNLKNSGERYKHSKGDVVHTIDPETKDATYAIKLNNGKYAHAVIPPRTKEIPERHPGIVRRWNPHLTATDHGVVSTIIRDHRQED